MDIAPTPDTSKPRTRMGAIQALNWAASQVDEYPEAAAKLRGMIAGMQAAKIRLTESSRGEMTAERRALVNALWYDGHTATSEILSKVNELPGTPIKLATIYLHARRAHLGARPQRSHRSVTNRVFA